jgi:thiol-disulfide isomerase/thioredoxin
VSILAVRACLLLALASILALGCRAREVFVDADLKFKSLDGQPEFSVASVPQSVEYLIINFFAPDCPPCEKEIPELEKFYFKYKSNPKVQFVAVGSSLKAVATDVKNSNESVIAAVQIKEDLDAFRKKLPHSYPRYLADAAALRAWRITGFPETFVFRRIESNLTFVRKIISEVDLKALEQEIGGSRR